MLKTLGSFSAGALALLVVSTANAAFWDTDFVKGKARTEYPSGYGTGSNWITLNYNAGFGTTGGCLWEVTDPLNAVFKCPGSRSADPSIWQGNLETRSACGGSSTPIGDSWLGCLSYSSNTYFQLNSPGTKYWVIHANNDPSFDQCRMGPPGASEPIVDPIANPTTPNLYYIAMESTGGKHRLHIAVSPYDHDFTCSGVGRQYTLPYLSVGANSNKGNGGAIGLIYPLGGTGSDVLHFKAQMLGHVALSCLPGDPCGNVGSHTGVLLTAQWSGKRRMLYLDLYNEGVLTNEGPGEAHWSWPLQDSMFWPGGDIAILSVSSLAMACPNVPAIPALPAGSPGAQKTYAINMSKLFYCVSGLGLFTDPMPFDYITVESVHWFVETSGTYGKVWIAIDDPEIGAN